MTASTAKFRDCFKISKEKVTWYPGHMNFSFKHMQAKVRNIDCIIEVHDSRIPFSGRNPDFLSRLIGPKPHILALNKMDLINQANHKTIIEKYYEDNCDNIIFTNSLNDRCSGLKQIIPLAVKLIKEGNIYPRENSEFKIMVVGVPNVGKSSLINALRNITLGKGRATAVGASPGVTKSIQNEIKISSEPLVYLVDTPGILVPNISNVECGMKLALCSCLKDSVVGIDAIADFMLYWMNKTENFVYVSYFGLKNPVDDIFYLLVKIAADNNYMIKFKNIEKNSIERIPNINAAADLMVSLFRKGKFGDLHLDKDYLTNN